MGPLAKLRETDPVAARPEAGQPPARRLDRGAGQPRSVLEQVTLADLAAGTLPSSVPDLTNDPDAWISPSIPLEPAA